MCFGGLDWWYHNRGHYDLQMMREFSKQMPVLYVNSLGMRTPRVTEGRMFLVRAARKLKSFLRGYKPIRENFAVLSPLSLPCLRGSRRAQALTARMVASGARRAGIERPLIWVNCPPAAELLELIPHARLVYQRTDRFESFPDIDQDAIRAQDRRLKEGDLTLYCTRSLFEEERATCHNAALVDHGVDYTWFAGAAQRPVPDDVAAIPGPRVGFVGGLDPHTFDPDFFNAVARRLDDCSFVLVGKCSLRDGWCAAPNVHQLGQRPYQDVASYMAACDVLIMPWLRNDWIKVCNPIKLKEYLAVGRPVVTTPFDELARYADCVTIADEPVEFAAAVRRALDHPPPAERSRARVESETWERKSQLVLEQLAVLERGEPSSVSAR